MPTVLRPNTNHFDRDAKKHKYGLNKIPQKKFQCKGISLSYDASEAINHDSMVEQAKAYLKGETIVAHAPQQQIRREKDLTITTTTMEKDTKINFDKRYLLENGFSLPWGYSDET